MTEALIWDIVRWVVFTALGVFFGVLIFRVLNLFLTEMKLSETNRNPGIWLETNWGGLGGGLSGWRVSNAVVYLFVVAFLLGCLMVAAATLPPKTNNNDTNSTDKGAPQGQKVVNSKGSDQKAGQEKDTGKANQKSDTAADDNQKKDADSKKEDSCGKKTGKPLKPKSPPVASGCSVTSSPTSTPTATATPAERPRQ